MIRPLLLCAAAVLLTQAPLYGNSPSTPTTAVCAEGLATTYADWEARAATALKSPEGSLKMYFDACFCYMNPATRDAGRQMLAKVMHETPDWDRKSSYATFTSRLKDENYHHIIRSFVKSTSPENGYKMDPINYELLIISKTPESDYTRVMLDSTGADSHRAAWVKKFPDGNWYVINNAGLYAGVRPPSN